MSDNVLKKEFQQKDVQRLRNLMQGKYGEKTSVGTGYTKQQESKLAYAIGSNRIKLKEANE